LIKTLRFLFSGCLFLLVLTLGSLPCSAQESGACWEVPVRHMKAGDYTAALESLNDLLAEQPEVVLLQRLKGVCLIELDRPAEAVDILRQAVQGDPDNEAARFYLAKALAYSGCVREAIETLRQLQASFPNSPYAVKAEAVIANLENLLETAEPAREAKRWNIYLRLAGECDDNVSARSDEDDDSSSSFRWAASSYLDMRILDQQLDRSFATVGVGLTGYASRHTKNDFDDYDLNTFGASVYLQKAFSVAKVPASLSLDAGYTWTELGRDTFSTAWNAGTRLDIQWSDYASFRLRYSVADLDFKEDTDWPDFFSRDGQEHNIGADQFFFLFDNRLIVGLGYTYRILDTEGSQFESDSHNLSGSVTLRLPYKFVFVGNLAMPRKIIGIFLPNRNAWTTLSRQPWSCPVISGRTI
jgi:tetratricopeptide (TPR) repeat protein